MARSRVHAGSFMDIYLHAAGRSEVPRLYHEWAAISLLAACLDDRVWFEKFPGKQMFPNLYVTLIGPSALGKDSAVDFAADFAVEYPEVINVWDGKCSGAGFADQLAIVGHRENGSRPSIYLIFPELSMSIGDGPIAKDFIKRLTGLYSPNKRLYREVTRAQMNEGRDIAYQRPIINALFGSTIDWLFDCVSPHDINSGFFGRMFAITALYDFENRVTNPERAPNHDELTDEIFRRLDGVVRSQGAWTLDKATAEMRDHWYQTRPAPDDEREMPMWKRQDDLILKVALCLAAAETPKRPEIDRRSYTTAQYYVINAHKSVDDLLRFASGTNLTTALHTVEGIIRKNKRITHTTLLKKCAHRGIHAPELKLHVQALISQRQITRLRVQNTGGLYYEWIGRE